LPVKVEAMSQSFNDQLIALLPRLRRFARGLCGSVVEADDLVQAACERALSRSHQFQEGTRFDSWMFRIVQTIWIDQLRARKIRKEESEDAAVHLGSDAPVKLVEARLQLDEVRAALQTIPAEQRAALLLVTVEGLSYREAAQIAQVPVGTIMSRLARARVALEARLGTGGDRERSLANATAK
jgi:RNA polymerase sigma-70 factor, ECF subfamily